MSRTTIPPRVVIRLWVRAGGRCEFPGCPKVLWRDDLTRQDINAAYIAHIVADSPDGPRGHPILSLQLAKEFSNLMLMCDEHHTLIDDFPIDYPVDMLQEFKRKHEQRIEFLTGIDEDKKTHLLFFADNIGNRVPPIAFEQARAAVLPRYPAGVPIQVDLTYSPYRDGEPDYFQRRRDEVSRLIETRVRQRCRTDGIDHLSIFALAGIPLLMHFGCEIGDTIPSDVYQYHRDLCSWSWCAPSEQETKYIVSVPELEEAGGYRDVALNLSLSGVVHDQVIAAAMTGRYCTYKVTVPEPSRVYLRSKQQLDSFAQTMRSLFARIRAAHGADCRIHVFPAIPAPIAVRFGQVMLPKSDPSMLVYENHENNGGFLYALTIPRREL
ncbi:MAG: SAVED domain-containing protein [Chloroflexota bacterium]|nr:MAG: SAVED domain-containing protein [Chloroflexota bacterium]